MSKQKREAKLPDDDPFAHLTAVERFARAVERRDTLTRDLRTPVRRGREPLARSTTMTAASADVEWSVPAKSSCRLRRVSNGNQ